MEKKINALLSSSSNYLANIKCDVTPGTPPFKCAVSSCKNRFNNLKEHQKSSFKFHDFPGARDPLLNLKWIALCKLPIKTTLTTHLKVCSDHFTLEDYIRNLKEEFLNPKHKRTLKSSALPSVNIGNAEIGREVSQSASHLVDNVKVVKTEVKKLPNLVLLLEEQNLKKEIKSLNDKIRHRNKSITKKKQYLAEVKKNLEIVNNRINKRADNTLHKFLSEAQINLLKGIKKVFWSDDDLAQAFTLRHMGGKDFYLYLKNNLNYPLPALSCVQAWAGNCN